MKNWLVLISLLILTSGCSTQYREADPQVSSDELFTVIEEILSLGSPKFGALNFSIDSLAQGNSSIIFHARENAGRPASSVLAMNDMSVIDSSIQQIGVPSVALGMTKVDVVFIDQLNQYNEREFSLLLEWEAPDANNQLTRYFFVGSAIPGSAQFSDTMFQVEMTGAHGEHLVIRSNDLSEKYEEELASSIKLEIYVIDGGVEYYAGQISTMAGYGAR
ncbi:MAG: hypothetical protein KDD38_11035 [Bdellovibrionales bacterium]|nr:hypothetical protein [Bdellovibrionales bacterium]